MRLSTGIIRANAYATKIRKVLYAMTQGEVDSSKTSDMASKINQYFLNVFKEKNIDKKDAIRIQFNFEIINGEEISVDWADAEIEIYKKNRVIRDLKGPE